MKTFGIFKAEFSDDSVEDQGGIVVPAGKNVANAICERLKALGYETTGIQQHSFYGWAFEFRVGDVTICALLQQPGPWLLILEPKGSWLLSNSSKSEAAIKATEIVEEAIRGDRCFAGLRWMTKAEFEDYKRGQHSNPNSQREEL
jgi:hypothetical protein